VRFWDTSALVPVLIAEASTSAARAVFGEDRSLVVWWGTSVECTAAIARASRDGRFGPGGLEATTRELSELRQDWIEIDPTPPLRLVAERLVRTHPLRAVDALQLSAAIAASEGAPATMPFVTLDDRLAEAAILEGFPVIRFDRPQP
jgi:predicted nucleic acid-binding protein